MSTLQSIRVHLQDPASQAARMALRIFQQRVQERCACAVTLAQDQADLLLEVDPALPEQGFRIDGGAEMPRMAGGSGLGLLYGLGKFLRTSRYEEGFSPSTWRGASTPQGSLRGMYFATHFHNFYQQAPLAEIERYLEDLALWGVNAILLCVPFINLSGWDDPQAGEAIAMLRRLTAAARGLGLRVGIGAGNTLFSGIPAGLRAVPLPDPTGRRGNSGHPVCPSTPEGHAYLMANYARLFEQLAEVGLDFLAHWPYDEGGCACAQCHPWGSNGFFKLSRDLTRLGQGYFSGLEAILSTWMFDTPPEGEWDGLAQALAQDGTWTNYVLADSHEDFPRYPLKKGTPGGLPLLNFPEISMWGNSPWGGMGANPLPGRFQALWNQVKQHVQGGLPYSEGIYEDMNKVVEAQFYWDRERSAQDTLREYCAYELGAQSVEDGLALVELFEDTASRAYRHQEVQAGSVRRAWELAQKIQADLPGWAARGWRWEILHCRALLDFERYAGAGLESPAAEEAMLRLVDLYHCQMVSEDPYHSRVRPPLRQAVSLRGNL